MTYQPGTILEVVIEFNCVFGRILIKGTRLNVLHQGGDITTCSDQFFNYITVYTIDLDGKCLIISIPSTQAPPNPYNQLPPVNPYVPTPFPVPILPTGTSALSEYGGAGSILGTFSGGGFTSAPILVPFDTSGFFKCECGSSAVGSDKHSDYCPLYAQQHKS